MQRDPHTILLRPIISEKMVALTAEGHKVAFEVPRDVNKIQVARAVEAVFGVKVAKVNTTNLRGKAKRLGRFEGRTAARKRAVVTLKPGHKVNLFES